MIDQRTIAKKIVSFATPTHEEIVSFEALPADERRAALRAELDKGFVGELSDRALDAIVTDARQKAAARRAGNG